jgi:hypothetical protein
MEQMSTQPTKAKSAAVRQTAVKRVSEKLQTARWGQLRPVHTNKKLFSRELKTPVKKTRATKDLRVRSKTERMREST